MGRNVLRKARVALIVPVLFFVLVSVSLAEKGPKIKFNEDSFDFGKVTQGQSLTHVFAFSNEGDEVLLIDKVNSSCGCTAALLSSKKINPGAAGEVKVTLNTTGYQGKISKYIYVESNDPKLKTKQITISADIDVPPQPKIFLDKYSSDEGLFLEGEAIKTKAKIINRGELELRVSCTHKNAAFYSEGKEISFPLRIPAGTSVEVEFSIPSVEKAGLVREYIMIKSNDPSRQTISFYISGYTITKKQLKELFDRYKDIVR